MQNIIRDGKLAANTWSRVEPAAELPLDGNLLVPLAVWQARRDELLARASKNAGRLGLTLAGNDEPAPLAADLNRFGLIEIRFPVSGDGRGYTLARLLRERYAYRGELRAAGDLQRDHLFFLLRCGFDSFELTGALDDAALERALASLEDFSEAYQASTLQPQPLFRRRLAAS